MGTLAILFAVILLLNLIPAFAPPTWMAMSWVGFNLSDGNPFVFAVVAACAATVGRLILAGFARTLVRGHWMRRADRENIDVVQAWLARRRRLTAGVFFLYALSPFPSNYLFIAYGLSGLPLRTIGAAFFVGRIVTYAVWAHIGRFAAERLDLESQPGGRLSQRLFRRLANCAARLLVSPHENRLANAGHASQAEVVPADGTPGPRSSRTSFAQIGTEIADFHQRPEPPPRCNRTTDTPHFR
ncbi:membrane protein [Burkholderia stagnalis]|nr:membrane protein [Burkholderia stagnalis]